MLDLNSIDSREDFKTLLATRAIKDANYRQALLNNPGPILERELGHDGAAHIKLFSHQEKPGSLTYIINYNPALPQSAPNIHINQDDSLEAILVKKAWKDPKYRQELLADPKSKLAEVIGEPVPPTLDFKVFEESRDNLHLRIPVEALQVQEEAESDGELSEAELEGVAGGTWSEFVRWLSGGDDKYKVTGGTYASGVRG